MYKNKEDRIAYQKKWREKNRAKVNAYGQYNQAERRQRNRDLINQLKDFPCTDCGVKYLPCVMDFDHINDDKEFNVSHLVSECAKTEKILTEVAKCELVCANCHRMRTYNRKNMAH